MTEEYYDQREALHARRVESQDLAAQKQHPSTIMLNALDEFMNHAGVPQNWQLCGCGIMKGTPERIRQLILNWQQLKFENEQLKRELRTHKQ